MIPPGSRLLRSGPGIDAGRYNNQLSRRALFSSGRIRDPGVIPPEISRVSSSLVESFHIERC